MPCDGLKGVWQQGVCAMAQH